MKLWMIDGIGPFFNGYRRRRYNWSKIPFNHLEHDGRLDPRRLIPIRSDFIRFTTTVANLGFNAITLDDLAHLADHYAYSPRMRVLIRDYRDAWGALISDATAMGLTPYLTGDVLSHHPDLGPPPRRWGEEVAERLRGACAQVLDRFPALGGIILRIGECDGRDVQGEFQSRLLIRTPAEARDLLRTLLPIFEARDKRLIFRTWTVGAHPIGDLIWNRRTFHQTFDGLDSPSLVLSMKYGESDFFRYLPLNRHFFRSPHQKLVELQTRREYEGFGEYPSFIGWDYEHYLRQLDHAPNMLGASVWCQTGGWGRFYSRTFLEQSSRWNEINTHVTIRLLKYRETTEQAVAHYAREHRLPEPGNLLTLLRLSDEVIKELLYIDDFARRKVFFRRLRVPPLLAVYWDHIFINHAMRKLLRCFVEEGEQKLAQGVAALAKIQDMRDLAGQLGLPEAGLRFQYDTFEILAAARAYYFAPYTPEQARRLEALRDRYRQRYATRYAVELDFTRFPLPRRTLRLVLAIALRGRRGYRLLDRLLMIRLLALGGPLMRLTSRRLMPNFAAHQAMGLEAVTR